MKNSSKSCAVVVGAGARGGIGGALCARFAAAGLPVYAVGRSADKLQALAAELGRSGQEVIAVTADVSQPQEVEGLFERIAGDRRQPEIVAFNAASLNIPKGLLETTPEDVETMWRIGCFAGFLVGRAAIRRMLPEHRGTLLFTGASASLRGRARFGAFSAAKGGLRHFAQAMAREFGPEGIHVAHVVIDGVVDGARAASGGPALQDYLRAKGEDGALQPDAIAEMYWQIHQQPRSAWTQELDLRPFKESF